MKQYSRLKCAISNGNSKLGAIPNISLIPGRDCGDVPCKRECYALKAWKQYRETRAAWTHNSKLAHGNPDRYFAQLSDYLTRKSPAWFRWHVAGDILDQSYLDSMKSIAMQFPGTRFLAFTKRQDLYYSDLPSNLAIVFSMWPGWGSEEKARSSGLPIAWMQDSTEGRVPANAIECPGSCENCAMCWNLKRIGRDVVFDKH